MNKQEIVINSQIILPNAQQITKMEIKIIRALENKLNKTGKVNKRIKK